MTDARPISPSSAIPADTTLEAWTLQMSVLRDLSVEQRLHYWSDLQTEMELAQRGAILRKYPGLNNRTVTAILVQRRHGRELAQAVFPEIDMSRLR